MVGVMPADLGLTTPADLRTLVWLIKDISYAARSSDPPRMAKAVDGLAQLHAHFGQDGAWAGLVSDDVGVHASAADWASAAQEAGAVAHWCKAVAELGDGELDAALGHLDQAYATFHARGMLHEAALTQVPRIAALAMRGRFDDATTCAIEARATLTAVGDIAGAARVSLNLGALQVRRGKYGDGAEALREAAVLFARAGDTEHSVMADLNQADALTALGQFDAAEQLYVRARLRAQAHALAALEALAVESLALLQLGRGQFGVALAGLDAARRVYESLGLVQQATVTEKLLADAYLELRLWPEALNLYDKVVMTLGADDELVSALAQQGRAQALLGQQAEAAETLARAQALFEEQGLTLGVAEVALTRAELATADGQTDSAIRQGHAAREAFDSAAVEPGMLRADLVIARAQLRAGMHAAARARYEATVAGATRIGMHSAEVRGLAGLGSLELALGHDEAAAHCFSSAVRLADEMRRAMPGDEMRRALIADHLEPYEGLLSLALKRHAQQPSNDAAIEVLQRLDALRARSLAEETEGAGTEPGQPADAESSHLRERLAWLHHRLQRDVEGGEAVAALRQEVRVKEHELLELHRRARLQATSGRVDAQAPGGVPWGQDDGLLDVALLQGALGMQGALIEYGCDDGGWWACVLRHDRVDVHRGLVSKADLTRALDALRFQMDALAAGSRALDDHVVALTLRAKRRLQQVAALIWMPLEASLRGVRSVTLVPCGELAAVPFAALHDGQCHLCERLAIRRAPSARLAQRLCLGQARTLPRQHVLVLADSTRLPAAASEAHAVAQAFGGAHVFEGEQARVETVRAWREPIDVLHLACHAEFRADNPRFSALHLADGQLTAEEVEGLALAGATVVLSACDTGRAQHGQGGEEMLGLVRAFLIAGAAEVVASLWPLQDHQAARFMESLYRGLRAGVGVATAVQSAQVASLAQQLHPFDWGGFIIYGGQ